MRLYIDPGTGSMLFAMMVGLFSLAVYFFKGLRLKFRFLISGGKKAEENSEIIPFVIFSDDKRYWPVFEPVIRELDKRSFDVVYLTSSPDDPALSAKYQHLKAEFIGLGNRAFMRLNFLKATILLSTTPGLDVYQWKRSRDVKYYIHLPHMPSELTTYRMFGVDYYDALLLSGQYQIEDCRALEKLRGLQKKECTIVGIPYLDEKAHRLEGKEPVQHERTVLVAPSWGPNSLLNRFGNNLIDELIATGYHIIIRPHPQSFTSEKDLIDRLMKEYPNLEWNHDTDNFDVLYRSDIMISDFSGVIFDYTLVFDKSVICAYTDFDDSQDDAWWLDTPIWTATAIPRIGPILSEENLPQLKKLIESCLSDESYVESRKVVRDETWENRGKGACLVADYLTEKYDSLMTKQDASTDQDHVLLKKARSSDQLEVIKSDSSIIIENEEKVEEQQTTVGNISKILTPSITKKKRVHTILFAIAGIAILLIAAMGFMFYMTQVTEKELERGDLALMQVADNLARIALQHHRVEGKQSYWFDGSTISLHTIDSDDMPEPYGCGTSRNGHAVNELPDPDVFPASSYDCEADYTNRIIRVTVDPETSEVTVEWVDATRTHENTTTY